MGAAGMAGVPKVCGKGVDMVTIRPQGCPRRTAAGTIGADDDAEA
jgi:hypothetical protein